LSRTKYVDYADRGFWAYDVALGVFLKHLIDAAEGSDQADTGWLSIAIANWRETAAISDIGLTLDADWSVAQRQTFIDLTGHACTSLAKRESLPADEIIAWPLLDDLRIHARGVTELPAGPVIELGQPIIGLVAGTLPEAPIGTAWLYGTDRGRETIGMRSS